MTELKQGLQAPPSLSEEIKVLGREQGGFRFDNKIRNQLLQKQGAKVPKALKTGTTIAGIVFEGGVVLGADTRATEDTVVADKNCEKIHYIAPNIYCCGAGTAADTENITQLISGQLELLRRQSHRQSRIVSAMTMLKRRLFQYQGYIGAALVLGGVDSTGAHLYSIYPHGSTDKLPFITMGSGSLAAMSVFESGYKDDLSEQEAMDLVQRAIRAGIFNDLGSGSNVDLCVIRANGTVSYHRNYEKSRDASELRVAYRRPQGRIVGPNATKFVKELFERHITVEEEEDSRQPEAAATSAGAAAESMEVDT